MTARVLCVGVITMDTIALVDRYPQADERVLAQEISRAGGGPAAVAAVALSRLGVPTAIAGTIGDDDDGREILRIFQREGIDATGVAISSYPTAGSVIVASKDKSTRAISSRQMVRQSPPNSQAIKLAQSVEWIHCDHVGITMLASLGIARGKAGKISFDAGYDVENFDPAVVDLFVPTDRQIALRHPSLTLAKGVEADAIRGQNVVVATRGSQGSVAFSSADGYVEASGFSVNVVSTLGAGDVFHGALIAQFVQGFPLQQALRRANGVAALSCLALDGQSRIPTAIQLDAYLEEHS